MHSLCASDQLIDPEAMPSSLTLLFAKSDLSCTGYFHMLERHAGGSSQSNTSNFKTVKGWTFLKYKSKSLKNWYVFELHNLPRLAEEGKEKVV